MLLTSTLVPLLPRCRLEQLNSVLAPFQGTHSYHNFTNEVCSAPWHPLVEIFLSRPSINCWLALCSKHDHSSLLLTNLF